MIFLRIKNVKSTIYKNEWYTTDNLYKASRELGRCFLNVGFSKAQFAYIFSLLAKIS